MGSDQLRAAATLPKLSVSVSRPCGMHVAVLSIGSAVAVSPELPLNATRLTAMHERGRDCSGRESGQRGAQRCPDTISHCSGETAEDQLPDRRVPGTAAVEERGQHSDGA